MDNFRISTQRNGVEISVVGFADHDARA